MSSGKMADANRPERGQIQELRDRRIGRQLIQVQRAFNAHAVEKLHVRGYATLTLAHLSLVPHLDVEGTRVTVLAERAGMTKQGAGQLVDDLERLGVLARLPDPTDGRAQLVTFTPDGLRFLTDAVAVVRELDDEYARILGRQRLEALRETLRLLVGQVWTGDEPPQDR